MKQVQIVEEPISENKIQLTEMEILESISKDGLISVLQNYDLPESFILKWALPGPEFDGLNKVVIISMLGLSESFVKEALNMKYFDVEDIFDLNMKTYSNLSQEFIDLYDEFINWERMILYLCSSDKIDNIEKYEWIIEKFNLWKLISATNLPIDFIRKNKNKLDWSIVSIINEFSENEREEFVEEIPNFENEWNEWAESQSKSTEELTTKDIRKMISKLNSQDRDIEVKHKIEEVTQDDIDLIKKAIQNGNVGKF
jgi:hypothetical protein